ncbi:MAG: DUF2797 domain-containing protein [Acidobacteriota bacterium]|nr:DUF2797 domain-containing protein [Acidobacteriota bacterium]
METYIGHLDKMKVADGESVDYHLPLDELRIHLNPLLGMQVRLQFTGNIHCCNCGNKIKKTYSDGHCYPCTMRLASCDMCILRPETCHYDKGTCREPDWGLRNCMTDHYVYLANTAGVKVGITRHTNLPSRWIDQGATQAIPILRVSTRLQSGMFEVMLKKHVADKTNWREMLKGPARNVDLEERRELLFEACADQMDDLLGQYEDEVEVLDEEETRAFQYPVLEYPEKIRSLNLDKNPKIEGRLTGIKGQYLIFDAGVINVRKFTAYEVEFSA